MSTPSAAVSSVAERSLAAERGLDVRLSTQSTFTMSVSSGVSPVAYSGASSEASSSTHTEKITISRMDDHTEKDGMHSEDYQTDNGGRLNGGKETMTFEEAMQSLTLTEGAVKHKDNTTSNEETASKRDGNAKDHASPDDVLGGFDMDVDFGDSSDSDNDGSIYDEIPMSELIFDEDNRRYTYPCPCGDLFEIYLEDLEDGEDIAYCPSCSLKIKVLNIRLTKRLPVHERAGFSLPLL
jgi:diphthamide biosynthesis protein 3